MEQHFAASSASLQEPAAVLLDGASIGKLPGGTNAKVRRRNRMITSCLECRRRKLKCDKLQPCTNCNKFSRECIFLAPALDSVSQQKLNEIKDRMGTLERTLEEDLARTGRHATKQHLPRKTSIDLPGEASSSDNDGPVPDDEKALEPTPLAVVDASYEDDTNDDVLDLGIRVGKMRMTERLGGYFRPKMSEEIGHTLENPETDRRTEQERQAGIPQLLDNAQDFLDPGPSYIAPGTGFLFGEAATKRNLIDFLPTKTVSDILVHQYYTNVHLIARTLHWPSFQLQYDNFWTSVLAGVEPAFSQQALVLAVLFSAVASIPEPEIFEIFGRSKAAMQANFQKGAELAMGKAQLLRTTKIETLQALVIYLIPMCRDQMSRAHSVLVGAAVRLAECMGLHRDPCDVYGLPPLECHVRRILWFQLCFLDFRTGEIQGPRPCIKREDYDTKFPLNIDDADLVSGKSEETNTRFTDMTISRMRFECNEMHRIIWYDRLRLEKKKISLTHILGKIESFRKAMEAKYDPILDISIPMHHYGKVCMSILLFRMHVMVLHRYLNNATNQLPDRLRQIIITSGTAQIEAAFELETTPSLRKWKWYNGTHQQWHTALLLLTEVYAYPYRREADRIWKVLDYVFEPDTGLSRTQKARTIMNAVADRVAVYRDLRKMRAPVSMRSEEVRKIYRTGSVAAEGKEPNAASPPYADQCSGGRDTRQDTSGKPGVNDSPDVGGQTWSFDYPQTLLFNQNFAPTRPQIPVWNQKQQPEFDTQASRSQNSAGLLDFSSPSENSATHEPWPPFISDNQVQWRPAQQTGTSPPFVTLNTSLYDLNPGHSPTNKDGHLAPPNMPTILGPTPGDDAAMLDIDWNEWDKLFPPDQNTGNLDITPPSQRNGQ